MSDELLIGLAGGAVGAVLAALFAVAARAWLAWGEITLHDEEAAEENARLLGWVDDRTRLLVREMNRRTTELAAQGQLYSGAHGSSVAAAKEAALHEFRDRCAQAEIDLARIRAREGAWRSWWRFWRRRPAPRLTEETLQTAEEFLERWREPVTRHGGEIQVFDRTRRTTADALAELPDLKLT